MSRQKVQYGTSSDYSEGLMGEIQRLIAPPNEEYKKKPPNPFKRGGRHNHDTCDACSEPGNLICCDYCTASFHLSCHDPPLEETDIPNGLWRCHNCRMKEKYAREKEERDAAKRTLLSEKNLAENVGVETETAAAGEEAVAEVQVEVKVEETREEVEQTAKEVIKVEQTEVVEPMEIEDEVRKEDGDIKMEETNENFEETQIAESETVAIETAPSQAEDNDDTEKSPTSSADSIISEIIDVDEKLTPFEELIRVASLLNPRQFELPTSMTDHFPFPGTERVDAIRNGRRVKTKRLVELDSYGCVPMPAKFCFTCTKTCKKAPLVSCDYCSLYFHQDCLDPPMTALPMGRWMCPNHPQHFIDWNLVSSSSATERMKVWDEYGTEPIDHEVVKLQFFRKVHMKNPPFRAKLKRKARDEVEIPDIVRYQYENPSTLLPSLRDVYRIDNLRKRGVNAIDIGNSKSDIEQIDDELKSFAAARERLKSIFEDQQDIHGLLIEPLAEDAAIEAEHEKLLKSPRSKRAAKVAEKPNDIDDIKMKVDEPKDFEENKPKIISTEDKKEIESAADNATSSRVEKSTKTATKTSLLTSSEMKAIDEQLSNLSDETIKLLAFQRFQQIVNENPNFIQKLQDKTTASHCVTEIAKWDTQRFPIPLPTEDKNESADALFRLRETPFHLRSESDKAHSVALSLAKPIKRSKIKSRAVFTFANDYLSGRVWFSVAPSISLSVAMRYRDFSIGYGSENNLDLSRFGECAFVSPKHAVVFFDDVTKQFELMNYSEYGSEVNGQIFCCDFTEHQLEENDSPPASPLKEKRIAAQSKIKNMIDAKKKIRECGADKQGNELMMAADEPSVCECKGRPSLRPGWEGTALLQHGYLLRFGCLSFVFSVAEYDSGNDSDL